MLRLRTIVATMMLNFCVRYGYRCLHHAFTTASSLSLTLKTEQHSLTLTSFRSSPRSISTSPLNMSPCLHSWPIYLIVFKESYFFRMGSLILEGASRLDAFSVYPVPAWLPCRGLGRPTGTPAAGPSRSSRTKDSSSQISCAHAG